MYSCGRVLSVRGEKEQKTSRQPGYTCTWQLPSPPCNRRPLNQTTCLCVTTYGRQRSRKYIKNYATWRSGLSSSGLNPTANYAGTNKVASWKEQPRSHDSLCENPATLYTRHLRHFIVTKLLPTWNLLFFNVYLFLWEKHRKREREEREKRERRERGRQRIPSRLCTVCVEPDVGLENPGTRRSQPESKRRVRCLTDWAIQVPRPHGTHGLPTGYLYIRKDPLQIRRPAIRMAKFLWFSLKSLKG